MKVKEKKKLNKEKMERKLEKIAKELNLENVDSSVLFLKNNH